jgi:hypothetical protein
VSTILAAVVVATGLRLVASHDYAAGAPAGFAGGFKEESCHACHFHEPLNSGPGRVTIDGVPATFVAGQRYSLTITLTRTGMQRGGFQLAARFKSNGAQAGILAPAAVDAQRLGVESQGGVQYLGQKAEGSSAGADDTIRWGIEWIAPERAEAVVFHVAANAADGNGSADGDLVYTTSAESIPPP